MPRKRVSAAANACRDKERYRRHREDAEKADTSTVTSVLTTSSLEYRRKHLAKISHASRVIAYFVPNFVAMATGVGRGKMRLAAFDGPSTKTPCKFKKLTKISYAS